MQQEHKQLQELQRRAAIADMSDRFLGPASAPNGVRSKGEARVRLNVLLRDAAAATAATCEHADMFASVVPVDLVTDYHDFVEPDAATACLEQIHSRTRACYYTSVADFRRDYEQLVANALAYNSPGHGRHAYRPIIDWSQDLLDTIVAELGARRAELGVAERALKMSMEAEVEARKASNCADAASDDTSGPLSSLEALVAACELAAEREGLRRSATSTGMFDINIEKLKPVDVTGTRCPRRAAFMHSPLSSATAVAATAAACRGASAAGALAAGASAAAGGSAYDAAPKYRRHKSKVYIRPNKVVYLPTTFMEENFEPGSLPVNCEMIVETNGTVQPDRHMVTIKSVPRQGLSTMYCMTNVMKFQQQFLNWQILNWTKVDGGHIKIHLQGPNSSGGKPGKPETAEDQPVPPSASPTGGALKRKSSGAVARAAAMLGAGPCVAAEDDAVDEEMPTERGAAHLQQQPQQQQQHVARPTRCSGRNTNSRYARRGGLSAANSTELSAPAAADGSGSRSPPPSDEGSGGRRRGGSSGSSGSSSPSHEGHLLQPCDGGDAMTGVVEVGSGLRGVPPPLHLPPLHSMPGAAYQFSLPMFSTTGVPRAADAAPQVAAAPPGAARAMGATPPQLPPLSKLGCNMGAPTATMAAPAQLAMVLQTLAASHPIMSVLTAGKAGVEPPGVGAMAIDPELSPSALKRRKAEHNTSRGPAGAGDGGRNSLDSSTTQVQTTMRLQSAFSM
uniref:Bromo domain-containing protein n=1 Tax=Chlamydomonas euryale TaxID=1486919 RepID=A0A7R9Z2M6_9CHLO|mmetsp:Transcript_40783/g.121713  ORF Transcript_40783/g.121713 Transcript_40783/m.121713 type:complete len:735 (+) Transcript_40783:309-2513(+)